VRRRKRSEFWETPTGVTVQVAAGFGLAVSVVYLIKNWNQQSAGYTLPVTSAALLESIA
jgi:hypothetical protein